MLHTDNKRPVIVEDRDGDLYRLEETLIGRGRLVDAGDVAQTAELHVRILKLDARGATVEVIDAHGVGGGGDASRSHL